MRSCWLRRNKGQLFVGLDREPKDGYARPVVFEIRAPLYAYYILYYIGISDGHEW